MRGRILVILAFTAVSTAAATLVAQRMVVTSDMSMFLPHARGLTERLLVEELHRGATGKLILIGLEGAPAAVLADTSRALAARLRASGHFATVANGEATGLSEELRRLLFDYRYLLSARIRPERFTAAGLRASLIEQYRALASSSGAFVKAWLPADPTGEFLYVLRAFGSEDIHRAHGVFFARDGRRAMLLASTRAEGFELDAQEQAVAAVHQAFAAVRREGMRLLLAGPPVYAVESRAAVRGDIAKLSLLATALVFGFLAYAFRSVAAVALSAVPLVFGILTAAAAVTAVFGTVHGITLAFGSTLLGVAVDYPIHFLSHLTEVGKPPAAQLARIWPTLRLGVITTVIGFSALLLSDYGGLAQLGVFSVTGLVAAAVATRWLLPALVPAPFLVPPPTNALARTMERLARALPRVRLVLAALAAAATGTLIVKGGDIWEVDLARLNPLSESQKKIDRLLRDDLGAPDVGHVLVVLAAHAEQALVRLEALAPALDRLVQEGAIAGYESAVHILPSAATQRQRQAALPERAALAQALASARRGLPFRHDLFEPFLADVERARTLEPLRVEDLAGTVLGERLKALLFPFDGGVAALVVPRGVSRSPERLAELAVGDTEVKVLYLDVKKETARIMAAYRDRALELLALGALGILLTVAAGLRDARRALRVIAIPVVAVIATAALLAGFGPGLTLFHLLALLLVVGIGIDYALFFDRLAAHAEEWHSTYPAVWRSWLTTLSAFGSLLASSAAVLQAIGQTVVWGVTLCLVLAAAWGVRAPREPDTAAV